MNDKLARWNARKEETAKIHTLWDDTLYFSTFDNFIQLSRRILYLVRRSTSKKKKKEEDRSNAGNRKYMFEDDRSSRPPFFFLSLARVM